MSDNNGLDINEVYNKHIDLYIHLDKQRWTFTVGVLIVNGALLNFACFFRDKPYFLLILGLTFIIIGFIIQKYRGSIKKFGKGQDFICLLLANIEERNTHIFNKQIESPYEKGKYSSFYLRRRDSIIKTADNVIKDDGMSLRQIQIYDAILRNLSVILYCLGLVFIMVNIISLVILGTIRVFLLW